jgi:hypothetical protein
MGKTIIIQAPKSDYLKDVERWKKQKQIDKKEIKAEKQRQKEKEKREEEIFQQIKKDRTELKDKYYKRGKYSI